MAPIHPLAGSLAQSTVAQRLQVEEKDRQLRRDEALRRNTALRGDRLDREVESLDAVALQEESDRSREKVRRRRKGQQQAGKPDAGEPGGLDLRA